MLALIFVLAKSLEELMGYLGLPPVLGDILAGILLGPSVTGILNEYFISNLALIKWLGIISLLFLAGLETRFSHFRKYIVQSTVVALGGIVVSFFIGYFGGLALGLGYGESIFLGAILTATSVGITAKTLAEIGALGSRASTLILGAAVLDDIGGLLVLGLVTILVLSPSATIEDLIIITMIAIIFYVIIVTLLHRVSGTLWLYISRLFHLEDTAIALLLSLTFIVAWASLKFHLSLVVGAYAVGLAFSEVKGIERVVRRFSLIPNIFAHVFFVLSAASVDIRPYFMVPHYIAIMVIVTVLAMFSKIIGCGVLARLLKLDWRESLFIGVGMMPRAEVALIIASIGMAYNIIHESIYAATILLIYVTSIVTPVTLSILWKRMSERETSA
ncbi:cation:proton antiporter [Desulfurococcaceae archaeon MEX13E-LK6-19]|nr:cation:proton antiporter [Desulfurococcaceae archaeon MEX13E-LK6-19]